MLKRNYVWAVLLLVVGLYGCAGMGLVEPESFEQRLAYAYGTNTAIREASTSALNAGTISSEDMIYVMGVNDNLRLALDAARSAARVGDIKTAEARLVMVTQSLATLQQYLRTKGVTN